MLASSNGSVTMTTSKPAGKRFELPALEFKFASLTDGTNIPPPLPSPVEEKPVPAAAPAEVKRAENKVPRKAAPPQKAAVPQTAAANTSSKINGEQPANSPNHIRPSTKSSLKRMDDEIPASPTLSARPGSMRRLFSRNLLSTAYANGEPEDQQSSANGAATDGAAASSVVRPDSRSNSSFVDERKSKRASGWFRRLRGGGVASSNGSVFGDAPASASRRTSVVYEEPKKAVKPASPPPPMIPELTQLKAKIDVHDDGSLGSDLFKNIK